MKTLLNTLFLLLTSTIAVGQTKYLEYTSTTDPYLNTGKANGGVYRYKATIKCRASAPGLGDVRVQCSILSFEILSFEYNGRYYNGTQDGFPIVIENIQSDFLDVTFKFSHNSWSSQFFSHKIYGVRKGAFDLAYLTDEEVKSLQLKTSSDFYDLGFSFSIESLTNTYFEELDNFKNGTIKANPDRQAIEKKQNQDDAFEKWRAQKEKEGKEAFERIEKEAEREKKQREGEEKQKAYEESLKSTAQKEHERDVESWANVFSSLNDINIPDADVERVSLGLSYANSNFNDLEVFLNVMNAWGNFYIGANFKGVMYNYDAWKPFYDTEDKNELFSSNILKEGDLLFNNYRENTDWSTGNEITSHRVYRKERERSYGFGLDLETGLRFQLSNSSAIRLGVAGDLSSGSNNLLNYGYGFSAQYELGRVVFGVGYNTRFYKYELFNDEYTLTELEGIIVPNDLQSNNDWAKEEISTSGGNEFTYYSTTHNRVENAENFNVFKQKFVKFSLIYKLH
jgi:hypothetical protein